MNPGQYWRAATSPEDDSQAGVEAERSFNRVRLLTGASGSLFRWSCRSAMHSSCRPTGRCEGHWAPINTPA